VNVPDYGTTDTNTFQIELFFDGRIRITWLTISSLKSVSGISAGTGIPSDYLASDLTTYAPCAPLPPTFVTGSMSESQGTFQALLSGPASGYEVQYSGDLSNWSVLGDITMTNGVGVVIDNSPGTALRFYRARALP
jgi:hypothetical protein